MIPAEYITAIENFASTRDASIPQIDKRIFVEQHLPTLHAFFSGEKVDMSAWLAICPRLQSEVKVMNYDGSLYVQLPPLLKSTGTKNLSDPQLRPFEVMGKAEQMYRISPYKGNSFLRNIMPVISPAIDHYNAEIKIWIDVFISNGYNIAYTVGNSGESITMENNIEYGFEEL